MGGSTTFYTLCVIFLTPVSVDKLESSVVSSVILTLLSVVWQCGFYNTDTSVEYY